MKVLVLLLLLEFGNHPLTFLYSMAANKKSFILYCDIIHTVSHLTDQQAGALFKHILKYVNDQAPESADVITNLAFEPIKQQLKRDLKKWADYIEKQSLNGKKGGRPSKSQKTQPLIEKPKKADNVNVTVNVNEREEETLPRLEYKIEDCLMIALRDNRWVKAANATEKELHEFNRLLESRGQYKKNPSDYKSHFSNWKMTGKKSIEPERREPQTTYKTL